MAELQSGRMLYLSQIIKKRLNYKDKFFGKVVDLDIAENIEIPFITQIIVQQGKKAYAIPSEAARFVNDHWVLTSPTVKKVFLDKEAAQKFYLVEDLLDKQVIDVNGKRLVRVNDVLLREDGRLRVEGIDIGLSGVLRRLGINFVNMRTITLPWSLIEAFDYDTGKVQLKYTQTKLNTFHPADLADILEEAGAKERLGVVNALDARNAALAISEADEETQTAILEEVSSKRLKNITEQMRLSNLAKVIDKLNPFTSREIFKNLGSENVKKVKKLLVFEDDVAGGLMDFRFPTKVGTTTIGEMILFFSKQQYAPETIIVVDKENKLIGTLGTRALLNNGKRSRLQDLVRKKYYVYEDTPFSQVLRVFAEYNLRLLPVVDKDRKVIGAIPVDSVLAKIQEGEEKEDAI
jgi:CBS domain-containing protein